MAGVSFHHLGKTFGQCSTLIIGVTDLRCQFYWGQNSAMLLPSFGSVVHAVVAQHIFHELSCLFHHTVMSLMFSDRQIWAQVWANIVNPNKTAPDRGLWCLSFRVHLSSALVFSRTKLPVFKVQDNYINVFVCQLFSAQPRSAEYKIGICLERAKKTLKIPNDSKRFDVGVFILFISSCGQTVHRTRLFSDCFRLSKCDWLCFSFDNNIGN